jgi:hypothetical protein
MIPITRRLVSPAMFGLYIFIFMACCALIVEAMENGCRSTAPRQAGEFLIPTNAPDIWVHPGVFVSRQQLDFISEQVEGRLEPWSTAFTAMLNHSVTSTTRIARPYQVVQCGPTSTPNVGCYQERGDSMAAYTNALAYSITNDKKYADKAIHFMDSWSGTIRGHNNSNAPLQTAWSAANWVRAGEIIRYSSAGWTSQGIRAFENMLRQVYLPLIKDGLARYVANWELVMMEATIGAAVFLEDRTLYRSAMSIFAQRVPAFIYMTSDGPLPIQPRNFTGSHNDLIRYWFNQTVYNTSGITQETCRDFGHVGYGIASISHVAETSTIQGRNLWQTDLGQRMKAALELHSSIETGDFHMPSWLCNGRVSLTMDAVLEPAYNALYHRANQEMPFTKKRLLGQRPAGVGGSLHFGFETLTNAGIPLLQ